MSQRANFDSPWKKGLEIYFRDFIAFFFPHIHNEIDWSKGYEFLDTELQEAVRDAELGKRLADRLVKVWRKTGAESWVLCHIEVQSQEESNFAERMFVYNYRIRDAYNRSVTSLAVLGDDDLAWRPQQFTDELWGCEVIFKFPVVKLLDYGQNWQALERSINPFATVVMAHLKAKETFNDQIQRKRWKFYLTRRLYEEGYDRQDVLELYRFIDWLMNLPQKLELEFRQELQEYQREGQVDYVSSIEKTGMQKIVIRLLTKRFGYLRPELNERIFDLSGNEIQELTEVLLDIHQEQDLIDWLQQNS